MKLFFLILFLALIFIMLKAGARSRRGNGRPSFQIEPRPGKAPGPFEQFKQSYGYLQRFGVNIQLVEDENGRRIQVSGAKKFITKIPSEFRGLKVIKVTE